MTRLKLIHHRVTSKRVYYRMLYKQIELTVIQDLTNNKLQVLHASQEVRCQVRKQLK